MDYWAAAAEERIEDLRRAAARERRVSAARRAADASPWWTGSLLRLHAVGRRRAADAVRGRVTNTPPAPVLGGCR